MRVEQYSYGRVGRQDVYRITCRGTAQDGCYRRVGRKGRRPRQYWIITYPPAIPPRCAKCATPVCVPVTPMNNSMAPYTSTSTQARIGIGGKSSITMRLGNIMPKASNTPNTPPEAPMVGYEPEPISEETSSCATPALTTQAK